MRNRRFVLLTRHFLRGYFENDLLSPDQGMQATLAPILAAIAAPGLFLPLIWSFAYGWPYKRVEAFQALVLRHEVVLVFYPMVIVALVAVLQWDSLYPDRRDAEVLGRLPVPATTMFWAKGSALLLFVGVFALASNGVASVLYPLVANMRPQPGLHGPLVTGFAHIVATFGAALFGVFAVLATMGVMQLVLPSGWRRRVSPVLQLASVLVFVLALLMLPFFMVAVDPRSSTGIAQSVGLHRLYTGQSGTGSSWAFWFPPFWFLGWYEQLAGRGSEAARLLAGRAQAGLLASIAVSVVCYLVAYRRHLGGVMVGDGGSAPGKSAAVLRQGLTRISRILVPDSISRAYFSFTLTTFIRSGKHRLIVGAAVGGALAFVLAEATVGIEAFDPARPGAQLLSAQFVFSMFLLAGMRFAFGIPTVLPANWAFRFHGPDAVRPCARGVRRAVIAGGLVPLLLVLFPIHALLFGWRMALLHGLCGLLASLGLIEVLLAGFPKVPFASAYVPGRAMLRSRLTLYVLAFQTFAYVMAGIESALLPSPVGMPMMLGCLAAAYGVLAWRRRRRERTATLVFDEDPPDSIQTLGLAGPIPTEGRLRPSGHTS